MDRQSPGRTLAAAGRGLLRLPRAVASGLAKAWSSLSVTARRRLVAALAVAGALALFFALAVPNLPCALPGGDFCLAEDDAQELVPADADGYVHATVDEDDQDFERASDAASTVPVLGGQVVDRALALLPQPTAASLDFEADVRPWLGGEIAAALLPGERSPVFLLEVEDADGADEFANAITEGVPRTQDVEGVEVAIGGRVATAQTDGFLVVGRPATVQSVVETASGAADTESLADDDTATEVRDELPEHRVAEAYFAGDGLRALTTQGRGFATLTPLVSPAASRGAAISLTATDDGDLELAVRSVLDPEQAESQPGFFAAFPLFEPQLPDRLQAESLAYLGIGAPRTAVTALLEQAAAQAPGIAAGFEDLVDSLSDDVDLQGELLDSLGGEAALALEPAAGGVASGVPFLEFVAADVDEDAARGAFAALQRPLVQSVNPGSAGAAPVFGEEEVGGVQTRSLRISPAVELTYAVFDELAAVATDPEGIAQLVEDGDSLDDSDRYRRATDGFDDEVSLTGYLDLGRLVALGEQLGLAEDPLYATFASDFRALDALGFAVSSSDELLSTDARLLLADGGDGGESTPTSTPSD